MRGHKIACLVLFSLLFLFSLAQAEDDYERRLDQGLTNNEPYAYALSKKADASETDKIKLLKEALKHSPDLPVLYFQLSKAVFSVSPVGIFKSLNYAIEGIKAYKRNFWWSLSLYGLLYVSLLGSLILCLAAVVLTRLPKELPLISHEIAEEKKRLLIPALVIPLSALGPLFFIGSTLLLIGFYLKKTDRIVLYTALLLLILSPFFLRLTNIFFSASTPELKAIAAVNEGKDNNYAIEVLKDHTEPAARFSYALALKRQGHYEEAINLYKSLLEETPDPRIYTNLGNAYVAVGETELAKEAYKKALEIKPSVKTLYNLSQVYRDELDFPTGNKYFEDATKLDRDMVSRFTAIATKNPNRFVIDETLSPADFWKFADKNRKEAITIYSVPATLASLIAVVILLLFFMADKRMHNRAFRCSKCGKVICNKCTEERPWKQMCPDCYKSIVKLEDIDPKERVAKLLSSYEQKNRIRRIIKILSFAPPGIAQIYTGRILTGVAFLWAFLFSAVAFALNPFLSTGLDDSDHWWLKPILIILMVTLYLLSFISVNRRLQRGWL